MKNRVCSLCSGCGGLDLGFINAGFKIVWANDIDKYAVEAYKANIGNHIVQADLNSIDFTTIPEHDILIAGFPCQPFSIMGEGKGFEDHRGTVFFKICELIDIHNPQIVVLENVGRLLTHKDGNTYKVVEQELQRRGYKVNKKILNSSDYVVPQTRNRIFIVCTKDQSIDFKYPKEVKTEKTLHDILQKNVADKYYLSERIKKTILSHGSGGYSSKPETDLKIARPLCATMAKMHRAGQDNYVTTEKGLRRLTPRECARLQGFGEDYKIVVSDCQAYKQFGNAVTVTVATAVANSIKECIKLEYV